MRKHLCHFYLFLATFVILVTNSAFAKEVKLAWESIPGSIAYEMEIKPHSGPSKSQRMISAKSEWKGELPFGVYSYRVRAIDQVKRPGDWTDSLPLIVVPTPPVPKSPEDGATLSVVTKTDPKVLSWEALPDTAAYKIQILQDDKPLLTKTVTETKLNASELPPGKYSWRVSGIVRDPRRASLGGGEWEGKPSETRDFQIEFRALDKPTPLLPSGEIFADANSAVRFAWKKVPHAKSYEVTVERTDGDTPSKPLISKCTSPTTTLPVKGLGAYRWKVRALASVDPAEGSSSEAVGNFDLVPTGQGPGKGYVALSGMFAPYQYGIQNSSGTGSLSSEALTIRLAGESWLLGKWGIGLGAQNTIIKVQGFNHSLGDYEAYLKYRILLGRSSEGWVIMPKAGLETRDYVFISPIKNTKVNTIGASFGFDLRRQLSELWSVGLKVAYFKPVTLSGTNGGQISGSDSARNLSAGLQAFYWKTRAWGLGLGVFLDRRSFSYTSPSTGLESVNMDALHLFGSVLYRF